MFWAFGSLSWDWFSDIRYCTYRRRGVEKTDGNNQPIRLALISDKQGYCSFFTFLPHMSTFSAFPLFVVLSCCRCNVDALKGHSGTGCIWHGDLWRRTSGSTPYTLGYTSPHELDHSLFTVALATIQSLGTGDSHGSCSLGHTPHAIANRLKALCNGNRKCVFLIGQSPGCPTLIQLVFVRLMPKEHEPALLYPSVDTLCCGLYWILLTGMS